MAAEVRFAAIWLRPAQLDPVPESVYLIPEQLDPVGVKMNQKHAIGWKEAVASEQ